MKEKIKTNKSLTTNLIFFILLIVGLFIAEPYKKFMINISLFALSGAITNWLAIYMLFEKIPYLYGSGVVPNRFQEFKVAINHLIVEQLK